MPIYDYKCPKCGNKDEVWKHQSEMDRREKCPSCEHIMDRQISPVSFHLKGTGWYVTDYKKPPGPKKNDE